MKLRISALNNIFKNEILKKVEIEYSTLFKVQEYEQEYQRLTLRKVDWKKLYYLHVVQG